MGHFFSKQKSASDRSQRFSEYDGRSTYAPPPAAVYRSAHGRDDDVYGAYRGSGERSGMQRSSVTASTSAAAAPPLPPDDDEPPLAPPPPPPPPDEAATVVHEPVASVR